MNYLRLSSIDFYKAGNEQVHNISLLLTGKGDVIIALV